MDWFKEMPTDEPLIVEIKMHYDRGDPGPGGYLGYFYPEIIGYEVEAIGDNTE